MKSRDAQIRMKRFQIEERRRQVGQIETMIEEFGRMVGDLDSRSPPSIGAPASRTRSISPIRPSPAPRGSGAPICRPPISDLDSQLDTAKAALDLAMAELEKEEEKLEREAAHDPSRARRPRRELTVRSTHRPRAARRSAAPASSTPLASAGSSRRGAGAARRSRSSGSPHRTSAPPRRRPCSRGPGGQVSIASLKGMPSAAQSLSQHAARIGQDRLGVDDRRRLAGQLRRARRTARPARRSRCRASVAASRLAA